MGAATSIFYLSQVYRQKKKVEFSGFSSFVKGIVLDSPFTDLSDNIKTFVDSKASSVPGFVVDLAIGLIESRL